MQIPDSRILRVLMVAALTVLMSAATPVSAFDPEATFNKDDEPRTILRFGFNALKSGNMEDAVGAFKFGAKKNDLASQWKLARMFQTGVGLPKDDLAAFEMYQKIAHRYSEIYPRMSDLAFVSHSVVTLGKYSLRGIPGTNIKPNPRRAEGYFYRAAAMYKDREAQYYLGDLYRKGTLGVKQPKSAVRWFGLSARKGHRKAQAQLGEMLFYGEGVRRRPVRGLVFITKAATQSAKDGVKSIGTIRKRMFEKASAKQRAAAEKIISKLNLQKAPKEQEYSLEADLPKIASQPASQ